MRVRMLAKPSGLVSLDDSGLREWPEAGEEIVLPDTEGAAMCAQGLAEPIAEPAKPETRRSTKG